MASRRLVPASVRDSLLGIPSDVGSLERNYVLPDEDLDLFATRRRPDNRLGLAVHIALLRHPGQGWLEELEPPAPLVVRLAEQVGVSSEAVARYAVRGPTRSEHRRLAIRHLSLRAFLRAEHMRAAILLAARAAFDTDDGGVILKRLTSRLEDATFCTSWRGDPGAHRPGWTCPGAASVGAGHQRCSRSAAQAGVDGAARARPEHRTFSADMAAGITAFHQCGEHAGSVGEIEPCASARPAAGSG